MTNKEYYGNTLDYIETNCGYVSVICTPKHSHPFTIGVFENAIKLMIWLNSEYQPLKRVKWRADYELL